MAKVTLSPLITGIKGRLGNMVFRVSQSGETFVTRSPDMSAVEWSPAQQDHRRRFKAAIVYEKQAAEKNRRPFQMAVSDYFKGVDLLSGK